jgi:non-specific serine/threonine protein kinase
LRSEAARLFAERAAMARHGLALADRDAPAVAEICRRLDGIPLAIELAALRVRVLSPQQIAARLHDQLRLLTGGSRVAPTRQQTLRAMVDWSYQLLAEPERLLFDRLSVFAGGWDLDAAQAVCADGASHDVDILDPLALLVDKSLVLTEMVGTTTAPRYRLLETLRQYARERLHERGETEVFVIRHAVYYLELAEEAEPHLSGPEQHVWLKRLEGEHDNLRAAILAAAERRDVEMGLRLTCALSRFWSTRHVSEGREHFERLLSVKAEDTQSSRFSALRATALHRAGILAVIQMDSAAARALLEESLRIRRQLGDQKGMARTISQLGILAHRQGDLGIAQARFEESHTLCQQRNDWWGIAANLNSLGRLAQSRRDYTASRALLEEALAVSRNTGDTSAVANRLLNLAEVALAMGDYAGARPLLAESLAMNRELGNQLEMSFVLDSIGALAGAAGQPARALRIAGAATAWREASGQSLDRFEQHWATSVVAAAWQIVGEGSATQLFAEGHEMPEEKAVAEALEVLGT